LYNRALVFTIVFLTAYSKERALAIRPTTVYCKEQVAETLLRLLPLIARVKATQFVAADIVNAPASSVCAVAVLVAELTEEREAVDPPEHKPEIWLLE